MAGPRLALFLLALLLADGSSRPFAIAQEPLAHWKFAGSLDDAAGKTAATAHGDPRFVEGPHGEANGALALDGRGQFVEIASSPAIALGTGDFTLALRVHTSDLLDDDVGDLISCYDSRRRRGFVLGVRSNAGATHSQANYRQLQFGIDDGVEPAWRDEGRPGNAVYGMSLAAFDGSLYCGTCEAGAKETGKVFQYAGPGEWIDRKLPNEANAVSSLAAFEGRLYAGTAKYRLGGSALAESDNPQLGGRIWRLETDGSWTDCGQLPSVEATGGMVVYRGKLYASSLYKPAGFFRYEGGREWTALATPGGKRVEAMTVYDGFLWATGYDEAHVYRFDGEAWTDFGQVGENTQTYAFAVHDRQLCVTTWNSGRVFHLADNGKWIDRGRLGEELEVMGAIVHNGQLYAGTLPLAEVHRYEGEDRWKRLRQLDQTPDVKYRRVWTMAQFDGRLYCTTLPSGKLHSLAAGPCVTWDRELAPGWRHVAAMRSGDRLKLFVDGAQVAEGKFRDLDRLNLTHEGALRIGAGPGDSFCGVLGDVRLYRRALSNEEIANLARH